MLGSIGQYFGLLFLDLFLLLLVVVFCSFYLFLAHPELDRWQVTEAVLAVVACVFFQRLVTNAVDLEGCVGFLVDESQLTDVDKLLLTLFRQACDAEVFHPREVKH